MIGFHGSPGASGIGSNLGAAQTCDPRPEVALHYPCFSQLERPSEKLIMWTQLKENILFLKCLVKPTK